jgi:hypothetical protein
MIKHILDLFLGKVRLDPFDKAGAVCSLPSLQQRIFGVLFLLVLLDVAGEVL